MALILSGSTGISTTSGTTPFADGAIGTAQLASDSVTTPKIAAGAVVEADIADGAVTTNKLSNSGVTAGTYGSSSAIPAVTVDAKGRITSVTTNAFSSTPTTAQVLSALSGITDCTAVGGYLMASFSGSSGFDINATRAGSTLRPCFLYTDGSSMYTTASGSALSGTWRQLAWSNTSFGFAGTAVGMWLRIS